MTPGVDEAARPSGSGYLLRPATVDDVNTYLTCHVECLAETYETVMPPEFAEEHRRTLPTRMIDTRRQWASGPPPGVEPTRAWLAFERDGSAVGLARSGPGPQSWERELGAPEPSVFFELHHIYIRRRTYGTGLGQRLLDTAVGGRDAYLWILLGNARAERFYRRNGFVPDGAVMSCGPTWFHRPMFRMVRRTDPACPDPTTGLPGSTHDDAPGISLPAPSAGSAAR